MIFLWLLWEGLRRRRLRDCEEWRRCYHWNHDHTKQFLIFASKHKDFLVRTEPLLLLFVPFVEASSVLLLIRYLPRYVVTKTCMISPSSLALAIAGSRLWATSRVAALQRGARH